MSDPVQTQNQTQSASESSGSEAVNIRGVVITCLVITVAITLVSIVLVKLMDRSLSKVYESSKNKEEPALAPLDNGPMTAAAAHGKTFFFATCFVCHGPTGMGVPNQGPALRTSKFVASHSDDELVAFINKGREPTDPASVLHLLMPPKGANPALTDPDIRDVVQYVRWMQGAGPASAPTPPPVPAGPALTMIVAAATANEFPALAGGGTNIAPPASGDGFKPDTLHGPADGQLIKLDFTIENTTQTVQSFAIGDLAVAAAGTDLVDFLAVGYDGKMCEVAAGDRDAIRKIKVEVPAQQRKVVSFIFSMNYVGNGKGTAKFQDNSQKFRF